MNKPEYLEIRPAIVGMVRQFCFQVQMAGVMLPETPQEIYGYILGRFDNLFEVVLVYDKQGNLIKIL